MKKTPASGLPTPENPYPTPIVREPDDETILARWLFRAAERGTPFWTLVILGSGALVVLGYLFSGILASKPTSTKAWSEVMRATSPEDLRKIAAANEETPAASWALIAAAGENYNDALLRMPADRDSALPLLTQAFDTFKTVAEEKATDDLARRMAILGMARTLETRGELTEAITQYERVVKGWPKTDDARLADDRARLLATPEAQSFYTQFAAYKPKVGSGVLPPKGTGQIDLNNPLGSSLPMLPPGHPAVDGPMIPAPGLGDQPSGTIPEIPLVTPEPTRPAEPKSEPATAMPKTPEPPKATEPPPQPPTAEPTKAPGPEPTRPPEAKPEPPVSELPKDPFQQPATPEAPKPAESKPEAPAPELPKNPFEQPTPPK